MGNVRNVLILNTVIGFGLAALNYLFLPNSSPREFWIFLAGSMVYSHVIGSIAALVIPNIGIRLWCSKGPRMWFLFLAALVAVGIVGTVVALALLWTLQVIPTGLLVPRFRGSVGIAVIITLIIGVAAYFVERLRHRGEATALELKRQQLLNQRAQTLASEARFSSLQSRLQPHFLFNTINSILALIREDPAGAERMLQRLARLLRYALDSQQRATVSLGEELKLVTDYLEIEQTRFGQRLRFSIEVPADLQPWPVPPYVLQTLIENSMKYVVGARREGGTIRLQATREGSALLLAVHDDGAGFLLDDVAPGHGLDTLIQRLHLIYGAAATPTVESLAPGCAVRLLLPGAVQ